MKVHSGVTITKNSEGGFVLNETAGGCFAFNAMGVDIWDRIEAGKSEDEIAAELAAQYADVDAATVRADVLAFIAALRKRDLVTE